MHIIITIVAMLSASLAWSDPLSVTCCQGLDATQLARATAIMDGEFLYDQCDDTISQCLERSPPSTLAGRLAGEICRRVAAGEDDEAVKQALRVRARSMMPGGKPASVDLSDAPPAGDPDAPVVMVVYACLRCPFCGRIVPELTRSIEGGALKGKAQLYFRAFPIKGHHGSTESGLALVAAGDQGKFWDFLQLAYADFDSFTLQKMDKWAQKTGMDVDSWGDTMTDRATRERLVASKKEGMANGVDATPAFFISGRRYHGEMTIQQLEDVLMEEHERLASQ